MALSALGRIQKRALKKRKDEFEIGSENRYDLKSLAKQSSSIINSAESWSRGSMDLEREGRFFRSPGREIISS